MARLARRPEPLEILRARYPRALEFVYCPEACASGAIRPGEVAANVFDFEDGLRLIISRDRMEGRVVLHFSASVEVGTPLADELLRQIQGEPWHAVLSRWEATVPARFRDLSGDTRTPSLAFRSANVPHWFIDECQPKN